MIAKVRSLKGRIARKPLKAYFIFSYVFFWLFLLLFLILQSKLKLDMNSLPVWFTSLITILGSWTPTLASVVVILSTEGGAGVKKLFSKFTRFRIPARWYIAALIPFGLANIAAVIYRFIRRISPPAYSLSISFWIGLTIRNLLEGPTGEEPGWRGFALQRLLTRHNPLKASLILGVVWDFWHLPLWFVSGYTGKDLLLYCTLFSISIISLSVLMTWIFCHTAKSLIPMVLIHFSFNASLILAGPGGMGQVPALTLWTFLAVLYLLTAIVVVLASGLRKSPAFMMAQ